MKLIFATTSFAPMPAHSIFFEADMSKEVQVLIAIIVIVGGFIGAYIIEFVRRKHRKREEHFKEIKEKVFRPLLSRLQNYYLPVIERKETNIKVLAVPKIEKSRVIDKGERTFYSGFEIIKGEDSIDNILYRDVRDNHFVELCRRFESFEERFMEYSKKCEEIIKDLKYEIINNIKLKDYSGKQQNYMHVGHLAIYLFEKSFLKGKEDNYLRVEDRGGKFTLDSITGQYALGDRNEIEECRAFIERLFNQGVNTREVLERLRGLKEAADGIITEIRKITLSQDLPGDCEFM